MATCAKCGKEYVQGMKGWFARIEGLGPGGRGDGPLARVLLCRDHFAEIPRAERAAWHEYTGAPSGPTREKRVGRLTGT